MRMQPFTQSWTPLSLYISCTRQWKDRLLFLAEFRIHKLVEFCLCVSLERLTTLVLSIPEGVVERRTAVHPVCAFTSIRRDCVGCSSVRGRVIVSVVRRVDSLAVHCLFTRSRSDNLSSSQILREDRATTTCYTCCIDVCISSGIRASVSSVGLFLFSVG